LDIKIDEVIQDKYEVTARLGHGCMGSPTPPATARSASWSR